MKTARNKNHLTVSEFSMLTKLEPSSIFLMLDKGELEFLKGESGELLIDISVLTPEEMAKKGIQTNKPPDEAARALLEEIVATELVSALDEIVDEALALALDWQEKEAPNDPSEADS